MQPRTTGTMSMRQRMAAMTAILTTLMFQGGGIGPAAAQTEPSPQPPKSRPPYVLNPPKGAGRVPSIPPRHLSGDVVSVVAGVLTLRLRNGRTATADVSALLAKGSVSILTANHPIIIYGNRNTAGVFIVEAIGYAGRNPANWGADVP